MSNSTPAVSFLIMLTQPSACSHCSDAVAHHACGGSSVGSAAVAYVESQPERDRIAEGHLRHLTGGADEPRASLLILRQRVLLDAGAARRSERTKLTWKSTRQPRSAPSPRTSGRCASAWHQRPCAGMGRRLGAATAARDGQLALHAELEQHLARTTGSKRRPAAPPPSVTMQCSICASDEGDGRFLISMSSWSSADGYMRVGLRTLALRSARTWTCAAP